MTMLFAAVHESTSGTSLQNQGPDPMSGFGADRTCRDSGNDAHDPKLPSTAPNKVHGHSRAKHCIAKGLCGAAVSGLSFLGAML
jgi:hypothetical protein